MTKTVVTARIAQLREGAYQGSLLCDELLCGTQAEILDYMTDGWVHVRAEHGYLGFGRALDYTQDDQQTLRWRRLPKLLVTGSCVDLQRDPRVRSLAAATLVRGSLVAPVSMPIGTWQQVALPGGESGYLPTQHLSAYPMGQNMSQPQLRQAICQTARDYLGCCYRWGGKTPLGIDCSGLTSQVYLLYGYTTYRDSPLLPGYAVREIKKEQLLPADLLYWPGHIALYLGEGRYIHSNATAAGVSINSLVPGQPDYRADLAQTVIAYGSVF